MRGSSRRILFNALILRGQWTGVEKAVYQRAVAMKKESDSLARADAEEKFYIALPQTTPAPDFPASQIIRLPAWTGTRLGRIVYELFFMKGLAQRLNATRFIAPAYVAPVNLPCKVSLYLYDLHVYTCPQTCSILNKLHYRLRIAQSLQIADEVVTPSAYVRDIVAAWFPDCAKKLRVEHIPISGIYLRETKSTTETLRKLRRLIGEASYFLAVGDSAAPRKNHTALVEAWRTLRGDRPALVIVGGEEAPLLANSPVRLGYVPECDMPSVYSHALALVYPSLDEGYGLPVAEAIACGTYVITTIATLSEFPSPKIRFCGTDAAQIANAMQSFLDELQAQRATDSGMS